MLVLAALITSVVLSSADVCDNPIPGGVGEPSFCVFSEPTLIQTPYFCFEAQPGPLVGIDEGGERVVIEGSIRQSPVGLRIFAHTLDQQGELMRQFGACGNMSADSDSALVCDRSDEYFVRFSKLLLGTKRIIVVETWAAQTAIEHFPVYQKMLESVSPE